MGFLNFIYVDVNDRVHELEQEVQMLKMNIQHENDSIACKTMEDTIWKNEYNIRMAYKIMNLIEKNNKPGLVYYLSKFYKDFF
jgi:hypothetical protein